MSFASGFGSIAVAGRLVPAAWAADEAGFRVRLAEADADSLGVQRGDRIGVDVPGRKPGTWAVRSATWVDPGWVWLSLDAVVGPARRRQTVPAG